MKANELRIGNYVCNNSLVIYREPMVYKVVGIQANELINGTGITQGGHITGKNMDAIPLTEEWLVKFGLKDNEYTPLGLDAEGNEVIQIDVSQNAVWIGDEKDFNYCVGVHVKYVHQLQNLYFALTGGELQCN